MDGLNKHELEIIEKICERECGNCEECCLNNDIDDCGCMVVPREIVEHIHEIKVACGVWELEHCHTYLKEFKIRFPKVSIMHSDVKIPTKFCCNELFDGEVCSNEACDKCWNREYKEFGEK